jgi:hypothetical protein
MQTDAIMHALEGAWSHAPPGREAAALNEALRELQRLLDRVASGRMPPRLVRS